jgi:hypothetical protein
MMRFPLEICTEIGAHYRAMTQHLPVATIQYSNGTVVNIFGPQGLTSSVRGRATTGRARGRATGPLAAAAGQQLAGQTTTKRRRTRRRRQAVNQPINQ